MTAMIDSSSGDLHRRDLLAGFRRCGVGVLLIMAAATGSARAQNVVAFVNGEPITALDIEARSKLMEVSSPTHKAPPKQEVLDDLINEKLEIKEAKRWGIEATKDDLDQAFLSTAQRLHLTTAQFLDELKKAGVSVQTYRARLAAQIVWPSLVRGRYQSSLEIPDQDVLAEMVNKKTDDTTSYDYTLRPILFLIPKGSPNNAFEERKREAEGLRNRFTNCKEGLPFASGLADQNVVVQPQIIRSSADIPPELRKGLDSVPVGQLTAPEVNNLGVQMYAVCAKDPSKGDNSADKKQARETLFNQKYEAMSKKYLQQLHHEALIEYPGGNPK